MNLPNTVEISWFEHRDGSSAVVSRGGSTSCEAVADLAPCNTHVALLPHQVYLTYTMGTIKRTSHQTQLEGERDHTIRHHLPVVPLCSERA